MEWYGNSCPLRVDGTDKKLSVHCISPLESPMLSVGNNCAQLPLENSRILVKVLNSWKFNLIWFPPIPQRIMVLHPNIKPGMRVRFNESIYLGGTPASELTGGIFEDENVCRSKWGELYQPLSVFPLVSFCSLQAKSSVRGTMPPAPLASTTLRPQFFEMEEQGWIASPLVFPVNYGVELDIKCCSQFSKSIAFFLYFSCSLFWFQNWTSSVRVSHTLKFSLTQIILGSENMTAFDPSGQYAGWKAVGAPASQEFKWFRAYLPDPSQGVWPTLPL